MKQLTLSISLFILSAVFAACKRYKYPFTENLPATAQVKHGEELYMKYCQKCHPYGEGGLGPPIYFLPGIGIKTQVRLGLGVMPNFKEHIIDEDELKDIVAYLKALR